MSKSRIKKGDLVMVIAGKDRDRTVSRRVLAVYPRIDRVLVEGAGMIKRHTRPNPQKNIKGGIVERESPIHQSNVMLVDPETKRPSRIGIKGNEDRKKKVRVSRASGAVIDK